MPSKLFFPPAIHKLFLYDLFSIFSNQYRSGLAHISYELKISYTGQFDPWTRLSYQLSSIGMSLFLLYCFSTSEHVYFLKLK